MKERSGDEPSPGPPEAMARDARRASHRDRLRTLGLLLLAQTIVLAAGWAWSMSSTRQRIDAAVESRIEEHSTLTLESTATALGELGLGRLTVGTPEWDRVQTEIEQTRLPAGGIACLIADDGSMLSHPRMRDEAGPFFINLGQVVLRPHDGGEPRPLSALDRHFTAFGRADLGAGGRHFIATRYLPGLGARLLVLQPEEGLTAGAAAPWRGAWVAAMATGGLVLLVSAWATIRLIGAHDRRLDAINIGLEDEVRARVAKATATRDALITGLARLADLRDSDTGAHLDRIAEYSAALAEQLRGSHEEIDDHWIERLRIASSMHDIGKVGIPDRVLLKPGAFSPEERLAMERHPVIGAETLLAVRETMGRDELVEMALRITLYHHERWDGTGYPTGLRGPDVPLEARVVALADVYDALTSRRVYKEAFEHDRVVAVIRESSSSHFDPSVVEAFLAAEARFAEIRARLQPRPEPDRDVAAAAAGPPPDRTGGPGPS